MSRGTKARRGGPHHELLSHNTLGEAGVVLDFGRGGELATGGRAVCHEALVQHSYDCQYTVRLVVCLLSTLTLQLRACQIDGRGVSRRAGPDNCAPLSVPHPNCTGSICGQRTDDLAVHFPGGRDCVLGLWASSKSRGGGCSNR